MDELALRKQMDEGAKAEVELNHPATAKAFAKVEADLIHAWRNTDARDSIGREMAWMALTALGRVRSALMTAIDDGKVASAEIEQGDPLGR
jgi:hypothetical protein